MGLAPAIRELDIGSDGPAGPGPDEWIRRLGTLPLMYQPGECWLYPTGFDVLGELIARVTGRPFGAFLQERIFGPLGMNDIGFYVPADKIDRLPTSYAHVPGSGELMVYDPAAGAATASRRRSRLAAAASAHRRMPTPPSSSSGSC